MDNNFNNQDNLNKQEQTDYYNNDSYYSNDNYDNNYSDTTYEEKEKKNGIWWKILLAVLILLIIILLLLKFCSGDGKSKDEKYTELTNRICKAAETYVMNNPNLLDRTEPGKSAIIKFKALADANLIEAQIENPYYSGGLFSNSKEDKYYSLDASVRLTVLGDGTLNCEMVDNSKDVTPPDLRLNGDTTITLAVGTDFEDPGYTATDDYDGDITDKVVVSGTAPNDKAGEYELTYTVSDSAGNTTTKKRKIIYEEFGDLDITLGSVLDGVTPMITLKGSNPYCMVKGTKYVEPGAVATDNVDGNISDKIVVTNNVTGNLMGAFRVIYKVEDSSGNEAIAYRAVIVTTECPEEKPETAINNAPTISLIGKTAVTVSRGTQYIDLGATAYDKEDGDLTSKIVTDTSAVNTNQDGIYKVIYRVTDSGGKTSTATRTVTVKSSTASNPVVRFTEDKNNIQVVVGEGNDNLLTPPKAVNENGVQVAVTTKIEDYTTKEVLSKIDWTAVGKYRVIYTAIHGNGSLKQTKSIVVTVIEDTAQIGGKDAINVPVRTENCNINEADLIKGGVTFTSKSNQTPIVTVDDKEGKACKIGTYEVNVTAKVGVKETTKKITVYVVNGEGEDGVKDAPSKVTITGNTANPTNVYNTNGVWVGGDVTGITLLFSSTPAANTEIAHFEVSTNCSDVSEKVAKLTPTTGMLSWTKEGKSSVCIRAVTTTGIAGPWSNPVNLYIDRTGPSVQFTHDWVDDENSWYNTPSLTLTYSAADSESGLSHFEYTYDDVKAKKAEDIVTYNEATGSLTVNENTEPTRSKLFVYVRAVDKAGNKGAWTTQPAYANMDTVKPNAPGLTVVGNNTSVVKIETAFTDGQSVRPSGFGKLIYTIDDGQELEEYSTVITMPENSTENSVTRNVKVWAVDKAGNKSDVYSSESVTIASGIKVTGVDLTNNGTKIESGASCSTSTIHPQSTFTLVATPIPSNASLKDVVWSVADANIATIDENGKVIAKNVGVTVITAKIGDVSTSCTLNVVAQITSGGGSSSGSSGGGGASSGSGSSSSSNTNKIKEIYSVFNPTTGKTAIYDSLSDAEKAAQSISTSMDTRDSLQDRTITINKATSVNGKITKTEVASKIVVTQSSQGAQIRKDSYESGSSTPSKTTSTTINGSGTKTTVKNNKTGKTTTTNKTSSGKTSSSKPGGCFLKGTMVKTKDGYKEIDKIEIGDIVLSYNEELRKNEYKKVTKLYIHENSNEILYELKINGEILKVTSVHRIYVKSKNSDIYAWKAASEIKVNDYVMDSNGNAHEITEINYYNIKQTVYNIEVEDNHNYYVSRDNILVHNRKSIN